MTLKRMTAKQGDPVAAAPISPKANEETTSAQQPKKAQQKRTQPQQKQFIAIACVHGSLVTEDNRLWLVATDDGARFPVKAVSHSYLAVRLLILEPDARVGFFLFWPAAKGHIALAAFHEDNTFAQYPETPLPNQLVIAGILESFDDHSFMLKVGRNRPTKGAQHSFIQINSPPPNGSHCGQWLQLRCQRQGTGWHLPQGDTVNE